MTKALSPLFNPHQELLKEKISEAFEQGEKKVLDCLYIQWAHRYGVNSLPLLAKRDLVDDLSSDSDQSIEKIGFESDFNEPTDQSINYLEDKKQHDDTVEKDHEGSPDQINPIGRFKTVFSAYVDELSNTRKGKIND